VLEVLERGGEAVDGKAEKQILEDTGQHRLE